MSERMDTWFAENSPKLGEMLTPWSMVLRARGQGPEGQSALRTLAERYYGPVYRTLRSFGMPQDAALEMAQRFMIVFCEGKFVQFADAKRGNFRAFLKTSLRNFCRDEWEKEARRKGRSIEDLEFKSDAGRPEEALDREMAWCIFDQAVAATRAFFQAEPETFEALRRFDLEPGEGSGHSHEAIAAEMGIELGKFRRALYRAREEFKNQVCRLLSDGVDQRQSLEEEVRWFLDTVAGGPR